MNPKRICVAIAALLLGLAAASAAIATTWPSDPALSVPIAVRAANQQDPKCVSDGHGGAFIAWNDYRSGYEDIYLQHVNAVGDPTWQTNGIAVCPVTSVKTNVQMVSDDSGGVILCWEDDRSGGANQHIYAQRVNPKGALLWNVLGLEACDPVYGAQHFPAMVSSVSGSVILTWFDLRGQGYDIYAQRILGSGDRYWASGGVAVCTATNDQDYPVLAWDGLGGAVVAWRDFRNVSATWTDIYAQRLNSSGVSQWATNGVLVCNAPESQLPVTATYLASGGVFLLWQDPRSGSQDLYAQKLTLTGVPVWTANGVAVSATIGDQYPGTAVDDGSGGAIVCWSDGRGASYDVYAQRLGSAGSPLWTGNGVPACHAVGNQSVPTMVSDGWGGVILAWQDGRSGISHVYAQRLSSSGTAYWIADGVPVCTASLGQGNPSLCTDHLGGAIVAWNDIRNGAGNNDIYAQRVGPNGSFVPYGAQIVAVQDVPDDQGGKVVVDWLPAELDKAPVSAIATYTVWRQAVPPASAHSLAPRGARPGAGRQGAGLEDWESLATIAAGGLPEYTYQAATEQDSAYPDIPYTTFMVTAEGTDPAADYPSAPDSGYSVDNLAPSTPSPFLGTYHGNSTALHWGRNMEPDFAHYWLYRGSTPLFGSTDTAYVDTMAGCHTYRIRAVDIHGNHSAWATLTPQQAGEVPDGAQRRAWLGRPSPNPTRGPSSIRFGLPRETNVSLAVYDARGGLVRRLFRGIRPAGEATVQWDGRDDSGAEVTSGLYFCRLAVDARVLVQRLVRVR